MTTAKPNLFTRDDTFFGICQGLGDDLGISPDILRIAMALGLFWSPLGVAAAYAGAGVLVLAPRRIFPAPVAREPVAAPAPAAADEAEPLPIAA